MTPADLSRTVLRVVRHVVEQGELRGGVPRRIVVERPRAGGRGDYASNAALQLAARAGRPPREVARLLADELVREPGIAQVEITGPGFLNLTLAEDDSQAVVREILAKGTRYGHVPGPVGQPVPGPTSQVVPGPTGQVVQVHFRPELRAAVWCDAVRRILRSQGVPVRVTCEEPLPEAWASLGIGIDAHGTPPAPGLAFTTPVPAPEQTLALGPDATRWALLHPAAHDRPRMTEEHLVQAESNPLFRVRYAHARAHALTRNAAALGFHAAPEATDLHTAPAEAAHQATPAEPPHRAEAGFRAASPQAAHQATPAEPPHRSEADFHATSAEPPHRTEADLHATLADHPRILAQAAEHRAPDRLTRHLVVVADALLDFQYGVLPQGDEKPEAAHRARLALAEAAGTVLAGGLSLLGIDAPAYL